MAAATRLQDTAVALFPVFLFFFIAFGGFIVRLPTLPGYLRAWAPTISFVRWAMEVTNDTFPFLCFVLCTTVYSLKAPVLDLQVVQFHVFGKSDFTCDVAASSSHTHSCVVFRGKQGVGDGEDANHQPLSLWSPPSSVRVGTRHLASILFLDLLQNLGGAVCKVPGNSDNSLYTCETTEPSPVESTVRQ